MKNWIYGLLYLVVLFTNGCIDVYTPPEIQNGEGYLVVEGFLNASDRSCSIKLSRTIPLTSTDKPEPVINATVVIEDENNVRKILSGGDDGRYSVSEVDIDLRIKYRIRITIDGKEYLSEFVPVTEAPPIDEIKWAVEGDHIQFYIDSHNPEAGTRYYRWEYTETWLYTSAFSSLYKLENGVIVERTRPQELYYCWKTAPSHDIFVGSTAKLVEDAIVDNSLHRIEIVSPKVKERYSVLVTQYSLTKEGYEYWIQMRDNTQGTGTFYDEQPSRIKGNIYASDNSSEPVLGYFGAYSIQQKRIFIERPDIPIPGLSYETDYQHCRADTLLLADVPDFLGPELIIDELIEVFPPGTGGGPPVEKKLGYLISTPYCIDCRLSGGTLDKPDFW